MAVSKIYHALDHKPELKKILVTAVIVATYTLINTFLRIHLPGVSNVDLRPQIVLIFVAGYMYGPWYGFVAGFAGNFCTDIIFGYGLRYLPSWTIGNGLIGALIAFYPYRKEIHLDRIGQLVHLVLFLILVNATSLTYAAGMENILDKHLTSSINFRYFFLPAMLSNVLGTLILFPAVLLLLKRVKQNYPIKLALANYYLTAILLVVSWIAFIPTFQGIPALLHSSGIDMARGNALVDAFNNWSFLLVTMLILSFVISGWMSKTIVTPLKRLEETVFAVMEGDSSSSDRLARLARREDEIGILSYTVRLLSEKLWETQKLFRDELEKHMQYLDSRDSGTDIFVIALISLFGKDALGDQIDDVSSEMKREMSNLAAVSLLITASGLRELADTYSIGKIEKSFADMDLPIMDSVLSKEERQALALAIDINLLFRGRLKVMDLHAPLSREMAFHLLEGVHTFIKSDKNYVGYVTEHEIVSKICDKWEKTASIRCESLEQIMNKAISQHIITGYQIKRLDDLAHFAPNLKISYSHSNIKHIKQVIGLLMSESLQAKLQLEPKRSSFYYRDEWEGTDDLHLESLEGRAMVAHMDEFDIVMEFTTEDYRDRFREIIDAHAKREFTDGQKVLYASWYQPLYCADVPIEGYNRIADIIIRDKTYIVHAYTQETQVQEKVAWFKAAFGELEVSMTAVWVNDAFFRYLSGDFD
ncbi:MAG: ECF transporter S component [Syntrophales bacterium]|nr:ECF transporter S component [Syntrophales bacterium]